MTKENFICSEDFIYYCKIKDNSFLCNMSFSLMAHFGIHRAQKSLEEKNSVYSAMRKTKSILALLRCILRLHLIAQKRKRCITYKTDSPKANNIRTFL